EDLLVIIKARAQDVVVRRPVRRSLSHQRFVDVIEAFRVGRKRETSQITSGKSVRHNCIGFDVQNLKYAGALAAFFYFIKEKSAIRRNSKRVNCRVESRATPGRINEKLIWSVCAFTEIDGELFLSWLP